MVWEMVWERYRVPNSLMGKLRWWISWIGYIGYIGSRVYRYRVGFERVKEAGGRMNGKMEDGRWFS